MGSRLIVTDRYIRQAHHAGTNRISVPVGSVVTPLARDTARQLGIEIVSEAVGDATADVSNTRSNIIAIGSDHGGFELKALLTPFLIELGWRVRDVGTTSDKSCDYPEFAYAVAQLVARGEAFLGVMIDGAGIGSAIACNKVDGIRAACAYNEFTAWNARAHNNANVLTLGSRTLGVEVCKSILRTFLMTDFEGGRHQKRVGMINDIAKRSARKG